MITFHVESWSDVWREMEPHWKGHWEEVAMNRDTILLDPDIEAYNAMERVGGLHIVVAREAGALVGYHISLVRPHLHYRNDLHAFTDLYYIAKSHRKGSAGVRLFKEVERTLKARGVVKMFTGTKLSLDMSRIFEYLGWTETERLFTKYIRKE